MSAAVRHGHLHIVHLILKERQADGQSHTQEICTMDSLTLEWQLGGQASVHTVAAAGTTKIGRSHDCDVVLAHPMVWREHAKFFGKGPSSTSRMSAQQTLFTLVMGCV